MKISEIGFVYMITSPTGRIYVGSTQDIKERWSIYFRLNCKEQPKLYNSFIKHGIENHVFEIIWAGSIYEMYKYENMIGFGFDVLEKENLNLRLPKIDDKFKVISEETRRKMSMWQIGRKHTDEHKRNNSIGQIGRKLSEENKKNISKGLKGKTLGKVVSEKAKDKISKANSIPVIQYDLNMNFIKEWNSATLAAKELSINRSAITACCKLKKWYSQTGGFKWKYK